MALDLDAAELPADAIEVGRITDAWGVKGWFKILPYSADPEALFSSKRWFLLPSDRGVASFAGCHKLAVIEAKNHSDSVVASAHGVPDRTTAEALRGARIFVARSSFPTAAEGEYYWVDLIGLTVLNRESVPLGRVKDLMSTGPQTVLVLEFEQDGKSCERMIPFVASFVDDVNLIDRVITVDWQPDY
ncbi:MAG: ribosome maturation factor RimM [Pseudomonadota bacterium]|jgi:16S rRNA processing protein RimM